MPFTLSHPAAVLPFARTKLVFSALVAGALAPDIGYFLAFSPSHTESHSLAGLLCFCVPAGLLLLLLFQKVLKHPLLALFPVRHQARLYPYARDFRFTPVPRFFLILLSLLVGSATHLVWDSVTHQSGWVVRRVPELTARVFLTQTESMPVYKLLQHGSTVLGLIVLGVAYFIWLRKAEPANVNAPRLALPAKVIIAFIMFAGACAAALLRTMPAILSLQTIRFKVIEGGVTFISAFLAEAVVFSLVWHLLRNREQNVAS